MLVSTTFITPLGYLGLAAWLGWFAWTRWQRHHGSFRWRRPPTRDVIHQFDPATSFRMRGGARVGMFSASWPLSVLTVDAAFAKVSLPLLRDVWITRGEVISVVRRRNLVGAIRFRSAEGTLDGISFFALDRQLDLVRAMDQLGWPVDRS